MLSKYYIKLILQWGSSFGTAMTMAWCIRNEYYSYAFIFGITAVILLIAALVTHDKGR
jgi:hypothetical protein